MRLLDQARTQRVFGREHEIVQISRLLELAPGVVTVSGRGGVGKTAVASEVLRRLDPAVRTVWVSLAGVTDPDLVMTEIAHALDVAIEPGSDVTEVVVQVLGHGSWVVALDNAEHLLAFAPALATLLDRCPELRVLVTSQAPMQLQAEQVVALSPLPAPSDPADTPLDELRQQPAVATYCRRALAVDRSFVLTEQNAAAIVELCRRLEGLPLAIELAAARATMLPAAEIVRRLDDASLDVLHRPRNDTPGRHHGLRAAIAWTYGLLGAEEQRALRCLSVNVGTFDLEAATALIGSRGEDDPTSGAAALDALSTLVDFHLVDPVPNQDRVRFAIPDSIRSFALDELERSGEADEVGRRRIGERALAARAVAEGNETCTHEASMGADRDDLLDALRGAIDRGLADDALDIARGLGSYWDLRGFGPVQEELLDRAITLGEQTDADPARLSNAVLWSAFLGLRHASRRDRDELIVRIRTAEQRAADIGDDQVAFHAQNVWLLVTPITGDLEQAKAAVEEGLRLADRNDHDGWRAIIQVWAGMLARLLGDDARAVELGMAALESARRRGDGETIVRAYMLLGPMADRFPDLVTGLPPVDEMIELARSLDLRFYEALLVVRGVHSAISAGDLLDAVRRMSHVLDMARSSPSSPLVRFQLLVLVQLATARGDLERAARVSGFLQDSVSAFGVYLPVSLLEEYQRTLDHLRGTLGDETFEQQTAVGAAWTGVEALDEATCYVEGLQEPAVVDLTEPTSRSGTLVTDRLTERQREVLGLLAAGLSNKEIAAQLGVRAKTVMHHTTAIYRELGVRGRSEATAVAFRAGLVD